jgi:excisionase family DNA binding protein
MSSDLPNSRLGHAKRDGMLTHKPEIKVSSKEVAAATNAPAIPRVRPGPSIGVLLTPKEAADYLRVSLSWLARARMRGDGPAYVKLGKSVRYLESAVIEWMKSRRRLSTGEQ